MRWIEFRNEIAYLSFETTFLITSVKGQHDVAKFNNGNRMENNFTLLIYNRCSGS
jgi:hypothetical protein